MHLNNSKYLLLSRPNYILHETHFSYFKQESPQNGEQQRHADDSIEFPKKNLTAAFGSVTRLEKAYR
jgi:hypothetical protein